MGKNVLNAATGHHNCLDNSWGLKTFYVPHDPSHEKTRRQILKVKMKLSGDFLSQDFIESIQHKMLIGLGFKKKKKITWRWIRNLRWRWSWRAEVWGQLRRPLRRSWASRRWTRTNASRSTATSKTCRSWPPQPWSRLRKRENNRSLRLLKI